MGGGEWEEGVSMVDVVRIDCMKEEGDDDGRDDLRALLGKD